VGSVSGPTAYLPSAREVVKYIADYAKKYNAGGIQDPNGENHGNRRTI